MIAADLSVRPNTVRVNPGGSLIRSIWNRHRQGIIGVYITLIFLCLAVHLAGHLAQNADYFFTISFLYAPLLFGFVYLTGIATGAGADIASANSGFSSHFFLLPMKTTSMVNWLALFGITVLLGTWSVVDTLILNSGVPLLDTLSTLAAGLMLLQMLVWMPIGVPFARIPLALIVVAGGAILVRMESVGAVPVALETVGPAVVFICGLLGSYRGVAMTRAGERLLRDGSSDALPDAASSAGSKGLVFKSPFTALFWMEWRAHGMVFPIVVGTICLVTLAAFFETGLYPLNPIARSMNGPESIRGPMWLMIGQGIPFIVLWMAACMGGGNANSYLRPASATTLIGAKFAVTALSTLLAWAAIVPFIVLWLIVPADDLGVSAPNIVLLSRYMSANLWICAGLFFVMMVLLTWKMQADNLFFKLSEREWLKYVYWIILPLIYGAPVEILVLGWAEPDFLSSILGTVPMVIEIAAAIKCIAIVFVCISLIRRKILTSQALGKIGVIWFIAVLGIFLLADLVIPSGSQFIGLIAALTILAVPAVRIGLAPLELDHSRHG